MRRSGWLTIMLAVSAAACGEGPSVTAVKLVVGFDSGAASVDRLRIAGFDANGQEAFVPGELPAQVGGLLQPGDDAVVLLPDRLAGARLTILVWGLAGPDIVAFGEAEITPELGAVVEVPITLGPSGQCGDGVVDAPAETCDTAIAPGEAGMCPAGCPLPGACESIRLLQAGSCQARCFVEPVAACADGDGCCPAGCSSENDDDCSGSCGNGAIDGNERCDPGIAAGENGACPTSCPDDGDACTDEALRSPGGCQAHCETTPITELVDGDGCCPPGGTAVDDNDCTAGPVCGDGVTNPGEDCDDGNADNLDGCTDSCTSQTGALGDPCLTSGDCANPHFCVPESDGLPGGYCARTSGCNLGNPQVGCTSSGWCVSLGSHPEAVCAARCNDDLDCRWAEGYACQPSGAEMVCLPP